MRRAAVFLAVLGTVVASRAESAAALDGRFRLVDQRYGGGEANLADDERPLRLDFTRSGVATSVTMRAGAASSPGFAWPAFLTDAGPLAIEMLERADDGAAGTLHARYRVHPSDDLVLEIVEDYRMSDDGRSLAGTYTVFFFAQEATGASVPRGSYRLVRRFEREP
jgi:hypothetical protein